jgi:energy-coupling factor transport system ATP-binding protein
VASVLAMEPDFLIVDEPTTGQDHRMVTSIMSLLANIHQQGKTVLIITHDMRIVAEHCPRSVVLAGGRTHFDGPTRDLFANPAVLEGSFLRPPQSVRLSLALREFVPDFPVLVSASEWIEGLRRTPVG